MAISNAEKQKRFYNSKVEAGESKISCWLPEDDYERLNNLMVMLGYSGKGKKQEGYAEVFSQALKELEINLTPPERLLRCAGIFSENRTGICENSAAGRIWASRWVVFRQRGAVFKNDSHYHGMQRIAVPAGENWALNTATVLELANQLPESAEPENASDVFVRPSHDPRPWPS